MTKVHLISIKYILRLHIYEFTQKNLVIKVHSEKRKNDLRKDMRKSNITRTSLISSTILVLSSLAVDVSNKLLKIPSNSLLLYYTSRLLILRALNKKSTYLALVVCSFGVILLFQPTLSIHNEFLYVIRCISHSTE